MQKQAGVGTADARAAKAALRDEARMRRDLIAPGRRAAASAAIANRFLEWLPALAPPAGLAGMTVSAYCPIRSEVDPAPLLQALAMAGVITCLPVVADPTLVFRRWRPGEPLVNAGFGTRGPGPDAPECRPDIVIVPCLAFDRAGGRLGYGAGHFDRALARLRSAAPTRAVAIAFAAQERATTFSEAHDQPLDAVVTEREVINVTGA